MAKWVKRLSIALVIAAGIGLLVWYLAAPEPLTVTVAAVSRGPIEATVVNTRAGSIKACRRAQISPQIGGQIREWPVREGMKVKRGDLLLALYNDDIEAQLALAESEKRSAEAQLEAACLQADLAERQAARRRRLAGSEALAAEQLDQAVVTAQAEQAKCDAARAAVATSRDQIAVVKATLQKTELHAPFDGVIAELNGELGEYITPSPIGITTLPAVDLIDPSCYYASAPLDEVDAPAVKVGMAGRISLDAFPDRVFAGRVQRIADYVLDIEKQARTVEIEVAFAEPAEISAAGLLAGYSADVEVLLGIKEDVLRVPTEAVTEQKKVFVFDPDREILEERLVTTGLSNWELTEIKAGLVADDLVVISTEQKGLEDGARATIEEPGDE